MIQTLKRNPKTGANLSLATDVFGDEFDVWTYDNQWQRSSASRSKAVECPETTQRLSQLLQKVSSSSRAIFEPLDDERTACLLSIPGAWRPTVAVRIVNSSSPDVLTIASRASHAAVDAYHRHESMQRRLYESESQLATFSNRINRGRSEVEWLKQLATHAELQQRENDPIRVAQKILPELSNIIFSRTIVYVADPVGLEFNGQPINSWQHGDTCVPDAVCRKLLVDHGVSAREQPVVATYPSPEYADGAFPGVLSAVISAVRTNDIDSGWILAINKDLRHLTQRADRTLSAASVDRNCEFGDFEAGLVSAAANALATHAQNGQLLASRNEVVSGTIRSLVNAIDAKDHYTCGHSDRVAEYARQIATTMTLGEDFCDRIYLTGLLHDVGKIGVPDDVLQKPGRLTETEFRQIQEHPVIGHDILKELADFDYVLPGVLHHHEAVDGSGYPYGLKGDDIPLAARILAVADAYDAMTSDRPYRDGMSSEKAESIIADGAGKQWDSDCVVAFQKCVAGLKLIGHHNHHHRGPSPQFTGR